MITFLTMFVRVYYKRVDASCTKYYKITDEYVILQFAVITQSVFSLSHSLVDLNLAYELTSTTAKATPHMLN